MVQVDLSNKQVGARKKKVKRKSKKDELDDEDLFLQQCISENKPLVMSYDQQINDTKNGAERVIKLYEERWNLIE